MELPLDRPNEVPVDDNALQLMPVMPSDPVRITRRRPSEVSTRSRSSEESPSGQENTKNSLEDQQILLEKIEKSSSSSSSSSQPSASSKRSPLNPDRPPRAAARRRLGVSVPCGIGVDTSILTEAAQRLFQENHDGREDAEGGEKYLEMEDEPLVAVGPGRDKLSRFVRSSRFNLCIGILILANTVIMGMELDQHPIATENEHVMMKSGIPAGIPMAVFDGFEVFFFCAFGLEFLARLIVRRCALFLEVATYVDLLALMPVVMMFVFNLHASKHLTLLRIVRLLKLLRLVRLFRVFKELRVLVSSLASAMRALVWIGVLLLILVYCAAIWCTMLIGHNDIFQNTDPFIIRYEERWDVEVNIPRYWGSILRSMFTLFQIFTLDDWNEVVRPIVETHQPWMLVFFVTFLFTTTFGLLNLLMGTIVEHAIHRSKELEADKERLLQEENTKVMLASVRLFSLMDKDGNGVLSARELKGFFEQTDISEVLKREMKRLKIKLDYEELIEICQLIAEDWEDTNNADDGIALEEFVGAATRLQGLAKSRDVLSVLVTAKSSLCRAQACETKIDKVKEQLNEQRQIFEEKLDRVLALAGDTGQPSLAMMAKPGLKHKRGSKLSDISTCAVAGFGTPSPPSSSAWSGGGWSGGAGLVTPLGNAGSDSPSSRTKACDVLELPRHSIDSRTSALDSAGRQSYNSTSTQNWVSESKDDDEEEERKTSEPTSARSGPRKIGAMGGSLRADRMLCARKGDRTVTSLLQQLSVNELDNIAGSETVGVLREYSKRRSSRNFDKARRSLDRSGTVNIENGRGTGERSTPELNRTKMKRSVSWTEVDQRAKVSALEELGATVATRRKQRSGSSSSLWRRNNAESSDDRSISKGRDHSSPKLPNSKDKQDSPRCLIQSKSSSPNRDR